MDLLQHIKSRNEFIKKADDVDKEINELTKFIQKNEEPEPGPYLIFYHSGFSSQRVKELRIIVERLYNNRIELLKSDMIRDVARPKDWPSGVPFPEEFEEITKQGAEIDSQIVLDFQSMLLFSGIALDDWAHMAAYALGTSNPANCSFDKIAKDDGNGEFSELWKAHMKDILWLDAFLRLYRNKMVVHRERPWQIAHTHSIYRLDWQFWTPIAHGWVTEDKQLEIKLMLNELAKKVDRPLRENIHELVLDILHNIAALNKEDRRKVYAAAEEIGFATPTFQQFAHNIVDFFGSSTKTLMSLVKENPGRVNLGKPPEAG
ncbi:MAG: hypothetical protein OEY84_04195 [Rhodospirillaceae bacterium]|nr:hypothetical protein [Rhodospirillaceae bacterium]